MKPPLGRAAVIRADARHLPLPDDSVDLIVTSPPYWSLRDYRDGDASLAGQIGSEPTPAEYLANLWECTREWARVLKPGGSLWVNLSDKYAQTTERSRNGQGNRQMTTRGGLADKDGYLSTSTVALGSKDNGVSLKSLIGLPWMYALGCTGALAMLGGPDPGLGMILRRDQIWHKTNAMPESVTDRCATTHEYLFHLVKQLHYYSAVDEIRKRNTAPERRPGVNSMGGRNANLIRTGTGEYEGPNPLGKLPGSVWEIATRPSKFPTHRVVWEGRTEAWFMSWQEALQYGRLLAKDTEAWAARRGRPSFRRETTRHFAAFPADLIKPIISGWSPPGICVECGEGRRPEVERERVTYHGAGRHRSGRQQREDGAAVTGWAMDEKWDTRARIVGYVCACPEPTAPTRPSVVLDPFSGTGTTPMVAKALGRLGIGADLSHDYCRLAQWRTGDLAELAKVRGERKPVQPTVGQMGLFEEASA